MTKAWHFLGSSTLAQLGKLTLREDAWRLPTGSERRYPVLHVGITVGVVPFVDPDHVLLIRQFRHLTRSDSWELPGGGVQPSNAYLDETAYCYIGEDLAADPLASDDDEFFERRVVSFREAVAMAIDDSITESVSKVALLSAALKLGFRS